MWTHTVLEIYQPMEKIGDKVVLCPWPVVGKPADWIEKGLVGYCQGDRHDLVSLIPLWQLLWWRLKDWSDWLCQTFAANIGG